MLQNSEDTTYNHLHFVERVVETKTVWALKSGEGFATSESNEFEDVEVITFWSDEALARALAIDEWESFEPASISLSEFLEDWLVGMSNDGMVVGANWDHELSGQEVEPLDLALALSTILVNAGAKLEMEKFKDIKDYHNQVKKALGLE